MKTQHSQINESQAGTLAALICRDLFLWVYLTLTAECLQGHLNSLLGPCWFSFVIPPPGLGQRTGVAPLSNIPPLNEHSWQRAPTSFHGS